MENFIEEIKYIDTEPINTICPLMSIGMIRWNGTLTHCIGNKCQLWHQCKNKETHFTVSI